MTRTAIALTAVCVGLISLRIAQAQTPPAAPALTTLEIVAARQAAMSMSGADRGSMKVLSDTGMEAKKLAYPADGLAAWAKALPAMFPPGTGSDVVKTEAKPEIWSDRAGFMKAAADFVAAADKLSQLAHANDTENFKIQPLVVGKSCNACHDGYRVGGAAPPPKKTMLRLQTIRRS